MKLKKHALTRAILATGLVAGLGFSQTAMANPTATDELEVQVELAAGLTLVCGTLNFGTINVELGDRTASNTVTVDGEGEATITGGGNAALSGGASAAECKITGINEANTEITASIDGNLPDPFNLSAGGSDAPTTAWPGDLGVALNVFDDDEITSLQADWDGSNLQVYSGITDTEHSFFIGGVLTIPDDDFASENMGTYVNDVTIDIVEEEV